MIYKADCNENVCDRAKVICCHVADSHIIYEFLRPIPLASVLNHATMHNDSPFLSFLSFPRHSRVTESELKNNYP